MKHKMTRRLMSIFSLILVVGLLAACSSESGAQDEGNQTTESVEEPSNGSDNEEVQTITISYNPTLGNLLGFIAKDQGFDKEAGLEFEFVEFSNTTDALTALRSNKTDVGVSWGTSAPIVNISQGVDFAVIGGHENGGMPVYAMPGFEYEGLESFVDKQVATVRMYTPDIVWRAAFQDAGYNLEEDVEIMEFKKPSEALEAVKTGKADIFVGTNSMYPQAMESGLEVIANSSDFWDPTHVGCRVVVMNDWLEENPDAAKNIMKAYIQAEKIVNEDPEYAVQIQQESTGVDPEYAEDQVLNTKQEFVADPMTDGIFYNYEKLLDINYIEEDNIDLTDNLHVEYYQEALSELQEEFPEDEFYNQVLQERFEQNNSRILGN